MDDDEMLYREMNEEDDYYMGDRKRTDQALSNYKRNDVITNNFNNNMKKLLALVLLLSAIVCDAHQSLNLWLKNGNVVSFELQNDIKTTFQNHEIVISSDSIVLSYPISHVIKYTFSDTDNAIKKVEDSYLQFSQKGYSIKVENASIGSLINIYSVSGIIFKSVKISSNVEIIDVNDFPQGTYIFNVEGYTFKIVKL